MGDLRQGRTARRGLLVALTGALAIVLAVPAIASAATLTVAPGASRQTMPCEVANPCEFIWAVEHATSGEVVQFKSGEYDLDGIKHAKSIEVPEKVKLEPAPSDTTRPLIKQTIGFETCSCAVLGLEGGDVVDGLEVDQAAVGSKGAKGAGAVEMAQDDTIERSILRGVQNGMYVVHTFTALSGGIRDTLVIGEAGTGIETIASGITLDLDNVTAIAHGTAAKQGIAVELRNESSPVTTLNATNTIFRGDILDLQVKTSATGSAVANLHYSDARTSLENTSGSETTINDTDHPMHGEPKFVSATNFEELAGSPTIDAGTKDAASGSLDLNGLARTFGAATDIGAYEFHPAPTVTPTPIVIHTSSPPPPPPPIDSNMRLSHTRFRAASSGPTVTAARAHHKVRPPIGTAIAYTDSQAATTTFTVLRPTHGVRSGKACVAPPRHRRHGHRYTACTRYLAVGSFTHTDIAGANSVPFSGRLNNRKLPAGTYRLTATPRNSIGETGATVGAAFTIVH
jgi:hypothetical protein